MTERRLPDVGNFIRQQRELAQQSIRDLARLAGVSNPYLSQIERGLRKDRKSTRLNSSHEWISRMPSSA